MLVSKSCLTYFGDLILINTHLTWRQVLNYFDIVCHVVLIYIYICKCIYIYIYMRVCVCVVCVIKRKGSIYVMCKSFCHYDRSNLYCDVFNGPIVNIYSCQKLPSVMRVINCCPFGLPKIDQYVKCSNKSTPAYSHVLKRTFARELQHCHNYT